MQNMKLKRVLGFTTSGRNSFLSQPNSDSLIYVAGCVIVILNPKLNTQAHLVSESKQNITTLAISDDGRFLASADCALKATIYIWDLSTLTLVARFTAHNVEVSCMSFSANSHLLVSVGSQHDMVLAVWDWRKQQRLASHKISTRVRAVSFSHDGTYFVTVGEAHVKYWSLQPQSAGSAASNDSGADINSSTLSSTGSSISLSCKSATLGEQKKNSFCDVSCGRGPVSGSTYCITKSGLLCEINSKRLLHKWVDLRTSSAASLSLGSNLIVIGCANGVVRCFSPTDLRFLKNLPRPHSLGKDVSSKKDSSGTGNPTGQVYPGTLRVCLNEDLNTVACVYNDRSIYLWDLGNQNHVPKRYTALYHSSCIWGIDMYPSSLKNPLLPAGSFVTCSSDDTLRIWNPDIFSCKLSANKLFFKGSSQSQKAQDDSQLSKEILKIIYTDSSHKFLCDLDRTDDQVDQNYDSNEGLRCLRISPDGKHLAVGSRSGAIRIFDFEKDLELKSIAAHDAEVLCLEYSDPDKFQGFCYLASSSRDKLIHIFDAADGYNFLQTIDDHVSSITALRFANNRARDSLQLISCGADQKIIFRNGSMTGSGQLHFAADQLIEGKNTFYDMEVDSESSCLMTACQDRMIRLFNVAQVKYQSGFRGSLSNEGTLIKIALDPTCTFLAASSTDKSICLYDYQRGECIASVSQGLSDLVTDLKFSSDGRHLVACSGDGCIFVWSSPAEIANAIGGSLAAPSPQISSCSPVSSNSKEINGDRQEELSKAEQRARLRSLPEWARQQMLDELDRSRLDSSYQWDIKDSEDHLYEDIERNKRKQAGRSFNDSLNSEYQVRSTAQCEGEHNNRSDSGEEFGINRCDTFQSQATSRGPSLYNSGFSSAAGDDKVSAGESGAPQRHIPPEKGEQGGLARAGDGQTRAKLAQSRDNLERIVSRERFVAESLVHKTENCRGQTIGGNSSLSGMYNTGAQRPTMDPAAGNEVAAEKQMNNAGVGKLAKSSGLSKSSHTLNMGRNSVERECSSDDELSSIDNELVGGQDGTNLTGIPNVAKLIRSPKPSLQRQSRRSGAALNQSAAAVVRRDDEQYRHTAGNYLATLGSGNLGRSPRGGVARKVFASSSVSPAIRTSRSECNLEHYGLDDQGDDNEHETRRPHLVYCEKVDLCRLSPAKAALSKELCQYVVDELQAISKYATRLHQKLQSSGDRALSGLLARGVQNSMDILSIVPPKTPHSQQFQSQVHLAPATLQSRRARPSSQPRRARENVSVSPVPSSVKPSPGAGYPARERPAKAAERSPSELASEPDGQLARQTRGNQMNIDQVLEAYSDRLFKMVQERMVGQQAGVINNAESGNGRPSESASVSAGDATVG